MSSEACRVFSFFCLLDDPVDPDDPGTGGGVPDGLSDTEAETEPDCSPEPFTWVRAFMFFVNVVTRNSFKMS